MKTLLAALLVAASPLSANAAVLLGSATFATANDLTRVSDGAVTYQFLDLTTTLGLSQATALATFGTSGFTVATSAEMTALYSAFGFTHLAPNGYTPLTDISSAESANFINYLGVTFSDSGADASLGSYIDAAFGQSYNCIGFDVCATDGFNLNDDISDGNEIFGVYLVRRDADVPEPAMLGLFGMGAAGLGLARRRKTA